jgi:UDP-glucose 4-epimerase
MSILVTGGAGYIGSHMVHALADAGEPVVVIDDLSTGFRSAMPKTVPLIVGDVGSEELVEEVIRAHDVTEIIHFAASIVVPDSVSNPLGYYRNNTVNARSLLAAAVKTGIKHFIFSSTAAVYGTPERVPCAEDDFIKPMSPYGNSKLMTEMMLRDVAAVCSLKYVVLRYFNVAGADPKGRYGQSTTNTTLLVQIAAQVALGIRPYIEIYGDNYPTADGTCIRDYIHVADLVDIHLTALRHLRNAGTNLIANCGYGRGYSVKQVLDTVQSVSGRNFERRIGPRRRGDAVEVVADAKLIRAAFGWSPRYADLPTIVEHALRWEERLQKSHRFGNRA